MEVSAVREPAGAVIRLIRSTISERRETTWKHQDVLGERHFPTAYRERATKSRPYLRWIKKRWALRADGAWTRWSKLSDSEAAIRFVFGRYAEQALAVARCESGFSMTPRAQNGQYLGIFQMGSYARSVYGHGETALEQVRAAYTYFMRSGHDWSPWACKP